MTKLKRFCWIILYLLSIPGESPDFVHHSQFSMGAYKWECFTRAHQRLRNTGSEGVGVNVSVKQSYMQKNIQIHDKLGPICPDSSRVRWGRAGTRWLETGDWWAVSGCPCSWPSSLAQLDSVEDDRCSIQWCVRHSFGREILTGMSGFVLADGRSRTIEIL